MEYILQLDKQRRYKLLITSVVLFFIFMLFCAMFLGPKGIALSIGLLFFTLLTPLLMGRNKFFLFLWIIIFPIITILVSLFNVSASLNPFTFLITGISMPYAIIAFTKHIKNVIKTLPFVLYLLLFTIVILLNIFRLGTSLFDILIFFNFHFISIFLIIITFLFIKEKNENYNLIFNWISLFSIANALVAIFQGVTGIGRRVVDGFLRVPGLFEHPNSCGMLINFFFIVAFYKYMKADTKNQKILWAMAIFINFMALIFTMSKTSIFIFLFNLFVIFLNLKNKHKFYFAFSSFFTLLVIFIIDHFVNLNLLNTFIMRIHDSGSFIYRMQLWDNLIKSLDFVGVLFGKGVFSDRNYLATLGNVPMAHNAYIQLLYEYGIAGWLFFAAFIYVLINAFKKMYTNPDFSNKYAYIAQFMVISIILIESFVDQILMNRIALNYAWIIITVLYIQNNNCFENKMKDKQLK